MPSVKMNIRGVAMTGKPIEGFMGEIQFRVDEDSLDMSRVDSASGMAVLANHNPTVPLGKVTGRSFEGKNRKKRNRSMEVEMELTETNQNKDILQAVSEGLFKGISPTVIKMEPELVEAGETWFDSKYEIVSAEVTEVSLTPIPANYEANMSMSLAEDSVLQVDGPHMSRSTLSMLESRMKQQFEAHASKEGDMPNENAMQLEVDAQKASESNEQPAAFPTAEQLETMIGNAVTRAVASKEAESTLSTPAQPPEPQQSDAQRIMKMGAEHDQLPLAAQFVEQGKSFDEYKETVKTLNFGPGRHSKALESQKYTRAANDTFDFGRFLSLKMDGMSQAAQDWAAREVAFLEEHPVPNDPMMPRQNSNGVMIPDEAFWQVKRRSLETFRYGGQGSTPIIPEDIMREQTHYLLTDDVPLLNYCSVLEGVTGRPTIPIVTRGGNLINTPEPGNPVAPTATTHSFPPNEGDIRAPQLTEKQFTPKTLLATVRISRQSRIETGGFADAIVRRTLTDQYAERIRQDIIWGTGANNISGVDSESDITTQTPAIANLAGLNFTTMVEMRNPIVDNKIDLTPGSTAYVVSPKVYSALITEPRSMGGDGFVLDNGVINGTGIPVLETTLAAAAQQGRTMYLGNWSFVWVAFWSGMEMVMDEISFADSISFRFYRYWDLQVTRPKAIVKRVITAD